MNDESYTHEHKFFRSDKGGFKCLTCDATPSLQNMRQNDNGSWSVAKPIKMSWGWRVRMWFHR